MSDTTENAPAVNPTPDMTPYIGQDLNDLVRLAPLNPAVRTHLLSIMKEPVPDDKKTYEEIADWCCAKLKKLAGNAPRMDIPRPPRQVLILEHRVRASETGHCRYSRVLRSTCNVNIDTEDINGILEAHAGEEMTWSLLAEYVAEKAKELVREADSGGDIDYDTVEENTYSNEGDGVEIEQIREQYANLREMLRGYLYMQNRELWIQLENERTRQNETR